MNASTIVLGGGGSRSLPLLDTPKPTGELHVGSTIWKNWAYIKYIFISLFSQAEHVRWKNSIGTKLRLGQCNILELRISCAEPKTMRIHDSKLQPNAGVGAIWYSTWNLKLRLSRVEGFGTGVLFWRWGTKIPNSNTRVPKFSQISPAAQWHNYAHFWYSKVDLDWIGTCSKICIFRGRLPWKNSRTETH
jgi:hypothetical protein